MYQLPGFNKYNTIIIDDYNRVTDCQPDNSIRIAAFDCLEKVMKMIQN